MISKSFSGCSDQSMDTETYSNNGKPHDMNLHIITLLRVWAVKFGVLQTVLDALLILKLLIPNIPLSSKSLLKTARNYEVKQFFPEDPSNKSEFVYFGIAHHLKKQVDPKVHLDRTIRLIFNIDGLPLSKSGGKEFWPIQGKIYFNPDIYEPFVVARVLRC